MAKSGTWENRLSPDEVRFLRDVADEIAMLATDADVQTRFRQGLTKFASQYARFKESWEADQAGTWQPEMGKPANPLGAIWPVTYGTGWKTYDELKPEGAHTWIPVQIYRAIGEDAQLLGEYALLAVIHDMVLPNCEPIGAGCLPQELAGEIWESLLNNTDGEGGVPPRPGEAIDRAQVKAALAHVKEDGTRVVSDVQEPIGGGAAVVRGIEELCAAAERLCELWRTTHLLPNIREIYEKARDEILPALETVRERLMAFCVQIGPDAFDAERKKNPAFRSAEERLDVQLYGRRGIGALVHKVESHRKNLRYVQACVNRFIAKLDETVRMLQRYSMIPSKPEITALGKLIEYLKHWSEDTPLDYELSGDSSHLAFLQSRNGVRIVDTLGEPFDSVMRDLEMLEKKPINDLIAELRTRRDEILAFTKRNGVGQIEGSMTQAQTTKPGDDCRTLPPLLPQDRDMAVPEDEVRSLMELFPQAHAVMDYGVKHPLACDARQRLTIAFDNKRAAAQRSTETLVADLESIPAQDRIEWSRRLTDVCSRVVKLVASCLKDRRTDLDDLQDLYREYLDVLDQIGFFLAIQSSQMKQEHRHFMRDFLNWKCSLSPANATKTVHRNHAPEKIAETETEDNRRRKGSPQKYSDDLCKRAQTEYDELRAKRIDSKGAWSTVAQHQGFPNGEAARAACYRYQKKAASAN